MIESIAFDAYIDVIVGGFALSADRYLSFAAGQDAYGDWPE